jgi:SAM-dependent methyltransferase
MRWQLKAFAQGVLSRIPYGRSLHHRLQEFTGSVDVEIEIEYAWKADLLRRVREQGLEIEGRALLDVGTGWRPLLPLLLHLLGAERVVTVDINPWLTPRSLRATLEAVDSIAGRFAEDFGLAESQCRENLTRLRTLSEAHPDDVGPVLDAARIDYRSPVDAGKTDLPPASFDYVITSNVLEHVPPEEIERIGRESIRLLGPGGIAIHHINPGDHFSLDPRVTTVNFLKFSPRAWRVISAGLAYHNRLRCPEYPHLFRSLGYEIVYERCEVDERALAALRDGEVAPHPTFAGFSQEELAGYLIDVFARVPVNPPGRPTAAPNPRLRR